MHDRPPQPNDAKPHTAWSRAPAYAFAYAYAGPVFVLLLIGYGALCTQAARHDDKDFAHLWLAGRVVATGAGAHLYDPTVQESVHRAADSHGRPPLVWEGRYALLGCFNYPPPAALLYAPFGFMALPVAAVVHAFFVLALAMVAAWLMGALASHDSGDKGFSYRRQSHQQSMRWSFAGIALLLYPPFFVNLSVRQNGMVTLVLLLGSLALLQWRRDLLAGVVLGMLVFKPNWLIAVGWMPLVMGRWRAVLGVVLGATGFCGLAALVVGIGPFADYVILAQRVANLHELPGYILDLKYNGLAVARRWFGTGTVASVIGWCSGMGIAAATAIVVWQTVRRDASRLAVCVACCICAAMWINPHLNYYDLLPTVPCVLIALRHARRTAPAIRAVVWALAALVYVAVPWDRAWPGVQLFPMPALVTLGLWAVLMVLMTSPNAVRADDKSATWSASIPNAVPHA